MDIIPHPVSPSELAKHGVYLAVAGEGGCGGEAVTEERHRSLFRVPVYQARSTSLYHGV